MTEPLRLLLIEDSEDDALLIYRALRRDGHDLTFRRVETADAMADALAAETWDVVIADYALPLFSGQAALELLQETGLDLPFIIVSGTIGEDIAVEAMRSGAHDYVLKDNLARLGPAVRRELQEAAGRQARRQAEVRFRRMADSIQDGLVIIEGGRVVYVNDRACEISGYPRDEFLQMNVLELAAPGERERIGPIMEEIQRTGRASGEIEFWICRRDGTLRCVQNRYSPSLEGDRVVGYYVVTTDITERKEAEREVVERRRYLERVLAAAPDAIVALDSDHCVVEWNTGAERLFGYASHEAVGRNLDHLINRAGTMEEAVAFTQQVMSGRDLLPVEVIRYRKDGSPVDVIAAGSPILSEDRLIGAVAIYTDISARKRAERLLQALNEAALAVEHILAPEEIFTTMGQELKGLGFSCAIFLLDDDRSRLFPTYYSYDARAVRAAETLLGVSAARFSMPVEKADVFRQVVREGRTVLAEGTGAIQQALPGPLRALAGQLIKILKVPKSIDAPLIVEEEIVGLLSVQSDDLTEDDKPAITAFAHQMAAAWRKAMLMQDLEESLEELRQTQTQLFQAQKMEALGRLAGGIAHDFNNLLTIIDISGRLLERQLHPDDPLSEHVRRILEAGERAANLTTQLLSFSRREIIEPRIVDLNRLVGDLGRMLQRIIGEDVRLVMDLAEDLKPVKVDAAQVEQVIVNLAVNARDAMPQGGRLSIETANTVLDRAYASSQVDVRPGEYVVITVGDTGVGMSDEVKAHLFEPFFTTKERGQGTGLGLPTVFGIIKQNGGHIEVRSEIGVGTTFEIFLPVTERVEAPTAAPTTSVHEVTGTETILLVEDEAPVRELAVQILSAHGYHVLAAENGPRALEVSNEYRGTIQLLLTDVVMPQMNGKELAHSLQAMRRDIRVLYISGYSEDVIAHHGIVEEGAVVLAKPFTLEALTRKVRAILDAPSTLS